MWAIGPRARVTAQVTLAKGLGVEVSRVVVTRLVEGRQGLKTRCSDGHVIAADYAIMACVAFSKATALLPDPIPQQVYARATVFFKMDEAEAARLADMPSVVYIPPDLVAARPIS